MVSVRRLSSLPGLVVVSPIAAEHSARTVLSDLLRNLTALSVPSPEAPRAVILQGFWPLGAKSSPEEYEEEARDTARLCADALAASDLPSIAAVERRAVGVDLQLALGCDLRVGCKNGLFRVPETAMADYAVAGGFGRLPRLIGMSKALDLALTSREFGGEEACRIGLLNELADNDKLVMNTAVALGAKVVSKAPRAIALAKMALRHAFQQEDKWKQVQEYALRETLRSEDAKRALIAVTEGTIPQFVGV